MFFDQKIKYLEYWEAGTRVRGAGFVRLECWGTTCNLIMQVSGLFEGANGSYPVLALGMGREVKLEELFLQKGQGRLELRGLSCETLGGEEENHVSAAEVEKIRIPLGNDRELVTVFQEPGRVENPAIRGGEKVDETKKAAADETQKAAADETQKAAAEETKKAAAEETKKAVAEEVKKAAEEAKKAVADETKKAAEETQKAAADETQKAAVEETKKAAAEAKKAAADETRKVAAEETKKAAAQKTKKAVAEETEKTVTEETMGKTKETTSKETAEEGRNTAPAYALQANLKPGKWDQLRSIYPLIAPFGDARRYLQISPGDFVILKDRSYRMVNNSFLLHGYFTYKHLILHRLYKNGEMLYYVGVPGSYYDKEKEVALLFGFESFESASEPAREGDFGYYMMRVEL